VLEAIFLFLFKYQPLVYEQGDFVWGSSRWMSISVLVAMGIAAYALFTYRGIRGHAPRDRAVVIGLRLAALAVLAICLFRPMLVLKVAVPQQNFVGVLLDDSRSMQVSDLEGLPRGNYVRDNFASAEGQLLKQLSEKFVVRTYRFSSVAERLESADGLTFAGTGTRLGDALGRARDELAGLPLSGLIVVTDGADTSEAAFDESLASLKAESIPVFPIGVGEESMVRDIQVSRVETPRAALKGTSLVVDVVLTQTGFAGEVLPLVVESEGRVVDTQDITMPRDGEAATIKVRFKVDEGGPRRFSFRIPEQAGEQVLQNNTREALIDVLDRRVKILYLEGEPRFEAKFVRQALERDPNIQVVLLQRTAAATPSAPPKFLRLGIDTPDELVDGFPLTEEELFTYSGLIIGSVEASAFTAEQLRMIADFVGRRGGGLLALGGGRSFAEGGWGGTPVAEVLPVTLDDVSNVKAGSYFSEVAVLPARAGQAHPVVQLAATEAASMEAWRNLPPLTSVNLIQSVKPGASTLLTGEDSRGTDLVVLAAQRYGRGKALALPVQDSWLWRMHASMAVTDTTHHDFWQRLLRWVADGVPGRVELTTSPDRVEPREPVTLTALVTDKKYQDVSDARVVAVVRSPTGVVTEVPMSWTVRRDGEYQAVFAPDEEGPYQVRVTAMKDGETLGTSVGHLRTAPSDREYFDPVLRTTLLQRLADETGGQYFRASDTSKLSEALTLSGRGVTVVEEKDLWDMPALFLLMVVFAGGEWIYRRARGMA
jgi:uncharacterized membrane protein